MGGVLVQKLVDKAIHGKAAPLYELTGLEQNKNIYIYISACYPENTIILSTFIFLLV